MANYNSEKAEAKEKLCELAEEQQYQNFLAKEAAAKAAAAREQRETFFELSNLEREQKEIDRKKLELAHKYHDSFGSNTASNSLAVNSVLVIPPITPAKGRADHFRRLFGIKDPQEEDKEAVHKETYDEDKLLQNTSSMEIV